MIALYALAPHETLPKMSVVGGAAPKHGPFTGRSPPFTPSFEFRLAAKMGCCTSSPQAETNGSALAPSTNPLKFSNKAAKPVGDENIPPAKRVVFGIVYPEECHTQSVWMYFNKEKSVETLIKSAAGHAGLKLDKGKLVGSPQRLNIFTMEGDNVRLDLEVEAHMGSTLRGGDTLILEKGNRLEPGRLDRVRAGAR